MNKETRDRLEKLRNVGQASQPGPHPALPPDPHPDPQPAPVPTDINTQSQTAVTQEVLGRHKNDGQKDHKGAR